jgi:subfamily B ATP-binding cassette protein MsbA
MRRCLAPLLSQEPAAQLIRSTARQHWKLLAVNLVSSVLEALSEGATLAVVFMAVEVLSEPEGLPINWATYPLLTWWPAAVGWLNSLPTNSLFIGLLALAVLLQALQSLGRFANLVSVGYFAAECRTRVSAAIHNQVLRLSFSCASGYKVGDLTDYSNQGPEAIRIQIEQTGQLLVILLLSATYLAVLVGISPWLLLAVLLMGGLTTLVQKRLLPSIGAGSKRVTQAQVAISSRITEDFQGLRLLHSIGQLETADQRLQARMGELRDQLRNQALRLAVVQPFTSFLPILVIALIAVFSLLLFDGRNSGVLPRLVTFVLALQRLNMKLGGFAHATNLLSDNNGRLDRLNQVLSSGDKQFRRLGGIPFAALQREIRLAGVSLQYSPELPPALREVSFNLRKGHTLALVGPSGSGKSSLADLLCALYAPTAGQILIDDTSLERLELASWQQRLGVVSQDTFLFNATIAENIAFGTPGATQAQIEAACEAAQAAGFIESLPKGYTTLVGERGYRLSGGQRQRLSLARAILRQPELLILDEATSALDSQSERLVQQAIERFERDHTVLVIAHRLSTIVGADQILVLEGGRVVQQGTHSSLLAEAGLYQQLWQQQSDSTPQQQLSSPSTSLVAT